MELLVREPGTFGIWTALVHSQSGLKPIIAINASNPLSTGKSGEKEDDNNVIDMSCYGL